MDNFMKQSYASFAQEYRTEHRKHYCDIVIGAATISQLGDWYTFIAVITTYHHFNNLNKIMRQVFKYAFHYVY